MRTTNRPLFVPLRMRAALPAAMTVGMQGLNSLSNLLIMWFLVRAVGVAGFGYYSTYFIVAVNSVAIVGAFVVSPLNSLASQFSIRRRDEHIAAATHAQLVLTSLAIVLSGVAAIVVYELTGSCAHIIAGCSLTISMCESEFWRRTRFLRGESIAVLAYDVIRYTILAAFLFGLPHFVASPGPLDYTLVISASYLIAIGVMTVGTSRDKRATISLKRSLALSRRMAKSGLWLASIAFLRFLDGGVVLLVSFIALGPYEAGLIRLAQTLVSLVAPAMQALEHVVPKMLGEDIRKAGLSHALTSYRTKAVSILLAFIGVYMAVTLMAPMALKIMHVDVTIKTMYLVAGFAAVNVLTVLTSLIAFELRAIEREGIISASMTISAFLSFIIAFPGVHFFGALGMIVSIILTRTVSVGICLARVREMSRAAFA